MSESIEVSVERFVAHKRVLARKYESERRELRLLVRFADEHDLPELAALTPALIEEFLSSRPRRRPRSFNHLRGVVAGLLDWAVRYEVIEATPLRTRPRRSGGARVPFLFDPVQARRLLAATTALTDNSRARGRGPTYRVLFALCYGLGLRAGEACGLRVGDVDAERGLLVVRGGKFGKSRLVPHGPRLGVLLADFVDERGLTGGSLAPESPLFSFDGRRCVHPGTASQTFHALVRALDLPVPAGVAPPRLHDLRHSFAVGCLLRWYREGLDPASRLHRLSTFMGHVDPISTSVYLTITADLLCEANRWFEAFASPILEEVPE